MKLAPPLPPSFALALALAVALTPSAQAGEEPIVEIEKAVKIIVADDDTEAIVLDGDDLEIGETRQYFTDEEEILVTKTADGFEIEVDGETIDIGTSQHQRVIVSTDGEHSTDVQRILVKTLGQMDGDHQAFFFHGDNGHHIEVDGERFNWSTTDEDGEPHAVFMQLEGRSAAAHLEESGALDNLDEATRQRVLDALKAFDAAGPHIEHIQGKHKVHVIRRHHDDEHKEH